MKELIRYVQELKNDDTEYEAKVVGAFEEALDMIQGVEAANSNSFR